MFVRRVQTRPHGAAGHRLPPRPLALRCQGSPDRPRPFPRRPRSARPLPPLETPRRRRPRPLTGQRPLPVGLSAVAPLVRRRLRDGDCARLPDRRRSRPAPREQALACCPPACARPTCARPAACSTCSLANGPARVPAAGRTTPAPRPPRLRRILARALHPASERETLGCSTTPPCPNCSACGPPRLRRPLAGPRPDRADPLRPRASCSASPADLTNTFHTGRPKHPYAARGRSPCSGHARPALDGQGFPRRFGGQSASPARCRKSGGWARWPGSARRWSSAARANLAWLREQGLHWITVERPSVPRTRSGRAPDQLQIWRLSTAEAEERRQRPEADPGEEAPVARTGARRAGLQRYEGRRCTRGSSRAT